MNWYNNPRNVLNIANVAAQQRQISIRSYDELINAISRVVTNNQEQLADPYSFAPVEFLIADTIIVPKTIILPEGIRGSVFRSLGRVPIKPANGYIGPLFDLLSPGVVFDGLFIDSVGGVSKSSADYYFTDFVNVNTSISTLGALRAPCIRDCVINAVTIFRCTEALFAGTMILNNYHMDPDLATPGNNAIVNTGVNSGLMNISGNQFTGGMVLSNYANRVIGNDFAAKDVDTSAGTYTYLVANQRLGGGSVYDATDTIL